MEWLNFEVLANMVVHETANSILVECPKNSDWAGWSFWISKKCVRAGSHKASLKVGLGSTFTIKMLKSGKTGKSEKETTAYDVAEQFKNLNENKNNPLFWGN